MRGAFLEDLTWAEADERFRAGWPVLVPVGAFAKEHGLHLPLKTDGILARHLAGAIAEELPILIAPTVGFGYYPAFTEYPGSQHLQAETFIALMTDILTGFVGQGVRRLAVLNTGYSTEAPLRIAARNVLERSGIRVAIADLRQLGQKGRSGLRQRGGGHADEYETSIMLAIAPDVVRLERARVAVAPEAADPLPWTLPGRLSRDPSDPDFSPTGATGDPTLATAESGRRFLSEIVGELVQGLGRLFPDLP
jgi:creatinine amidohydrolase